MPRILVILVICICAAATDASAQYGYFKNVYTDSTMGPILKTRPASLLWYYLNAGIELPLGKNRYLDLNLGIPGIGARPRSTIPGGSMVSVGIIFPLSHNSPYSVFFWEPEAVYGRTRQQFEIYNGQGSVSETVRPYATMFYVNNHFGYRHVNPNSRFFYSVGVSIGFGKITIDETPSAPFSYAYGISPVPYSMLITRGYFYSEDDNTISPVAFSTRFTIGTVLHRKPKK